MNLLGAVLLVFCTLVVVCGAVQDNPRQFVLRVNSDGTVSNGRHKPDKRDLVAKALYKSNNVALKVLDDALKNMENENKKEEESQEAQTHISAEADPVQGQFDLVSLNSWNRQIVSNVKPAFRGPLLELVKTLQNYGTFLKLKNPVPNGHRVFYEVLKGQKKEAKAIGKLLQLTIDDDSIEGPGEMRSEDVEVGGEPLSAAKRMDLRVNNARMIRVVAAGFRSPLIKLVVRLTHSPFKTFIRLSDPVKNGHVVDYHVVTGHANEVKVLAGSLGLSATDNQIIMKEKGEVLATADETHGFTPTTAPLKAEPLN